MILKEANELVEEYNSLDELSRRDVDQLKLAEAYRIRREAQYRTLTPLQRQSGKAQKINSVICLTNGVNHKHVTSCRSISQAGLNYQQTIIPTGKTIIAGHKVITYSVKCEQILGTGLIQCKGNGHCHTLCQHSLSGVRAVVKAQGKTLKTAKTWSNALKAGRGILVKLVGESGFCYGVISNA